MFVILSAIVVFAGFLIFAFPRLMVGIVLTESKIIISYFGITVKSILYSQIVYIGKGTGSRSDFTGVLDGLLTMRIVTTWTTNWVLIKLKPGTGLFQNWVIFVRDPESLIESINAKI